MLNVIDEFTHRASASTVTVAGSTLTRWPSARTAQPTSRPTFPQFHSETFSVAVLVTAFHVRVGFGPICRQGWRSTSNSIAVDARSPPCSTTTTTRYVPGGGRRSPRVGSKTMARRSAAVGTTWSHGAATPGRVVIAGGVGSGRPERDHAHRRRPATPDPNLRSLDSDA